MDVGDAAMKTSDIIAILKTHCFVDDVQHRPVRRYPYAELVIQHRASLTQTSASRPIEDAMRRKICRILESAVLDGKHMLKHAKGAWKRVA